MSASTTVVNHSLVSTDDVELVHVDLGDSTGREDDANVTQNTYEPKRDWKLLSQLISCGVSFFVAGVNDGSLGALLPYVIRSYGLTTAIASSV
jgi:fucose permease